VLRSVQKSKDEQTVYPVIAGMAIGNPQYRCTQDQALTVASKCPGLESIKPVLERIYGNSRIGSRYFAVPDFTPAQAAKGDPMFFPADGSYEVRGGVEISQNIACLLASQTRWELLPEQAARACF